jgi:hypothetical protein
VTTRLRFGLVALAVLVAFGAAIPVVAFVVVPVFVRHTLVEPAPAPEVTSPPAQERMGEPTAPSATVVTGMLRRIDAVHYGSGRVTLTGRSTAGAVLRFENVDIAGAPNMFVYLSDRSDGQPGHYVDLGPLKATNGSFNYPVPETVDLAAVRSVVVWCRAFSVTVTFAPVA